MKFKRIKKFWSVILLVVLLLSSGAKVSDKKKPNILWIYLEDTNPFKGYYNFS